MRKYHASLVMAYMVMLALGLAGCSTQETAPTPMPTTPPEREVTMEWSLTSTAFSQDAAIPPKHTADGADVSPELSWTAPPEGTVELALICNDPDAPVGNWIHWALYGLSPDIRELPEAVPTSGTLPDLGGAKQGRNDFGKVGYGGPSPPRGPAHHYHFRLYALDAPVNLTTGATAAELKNEIEGHILGETELVGLYSR